MSQGETSAAGAASEGLMGRVILPVAAALVVTAGLIVLTPLSSTPTSATATANAASRTASADTAGLTLLDSQAAGRAETPAGDADDGANATARVQTAELDRADVEGIIRDYLLKNPEIMIEVQAALEAKMTAQQAEQTAQALKNNAAGLFKTTSAPIAGNPDGDVTVVEFFDYNCGFCKRALDGMAELIKKDDNVRVVLKEFPIFGEQSEQAARVALAAREQGKYWEVHTGLLTEPGRANKAKGLKVAKQHGLDIAKLEADMTSDKVTEEIERVQRLAREMGIRGTPHFLVDDKVIPGAPEDLLQQLEARVAQVRESGCTYC